MTRRRSTGKEARAMQAGCNAVADQFERFRRETVAMLADCPDEKRREMLTRALKRIDAEMAIMRRCEPL
jgi:hypothetical protein